jgi:pseudaminic acid synthase
VKTPFSINGRPITKDNSPYIVAEISGNHNGELSKAIELINQAKWAGADAVKIQTYSPDTITIDHNSPDFILRDGLWKGKKLYDLYKIAHTPVEWHEPLFDHAKHIGITLFSSPFDHTAIDLLEDLQTPAYKIASPEIIDSNLIKLCAQTGKPIIISTGMASLKEIGEAIEIARAAGASQILLLHCISAYPTPLEESNLATIGDLAQRFKSPVGLSDHSSGNFAATLAVAQGAVLIEKHFTLSKSDGAIDNAFSIEPKELKQLVSDAKTAYLALGKPNYLPTKNEKLMLIARRSLYVVANVKAGDIFTSQNIRSIRPNLGLHPKFYENVLGKLATEDIKRGQPLMFSMVSDLED